MFPVIYAQLRIILFAIKESTQHQGVSQFGPSLMDLFFPPMVCCAKDKMAGVCLLYLTNV